MIIIIVNDTIVSMDQEIVRLHKLNITGYHKILLFFGEHTCKAMAGIATSILIINHISPNDYGVITMSLTIIGVLTAVTALGLDGILLKEFILKFNVMDLRSSIALRLITSMIVTVVIGIITLVTNNLIALLVLAMSLTLFFESFNATKEYHFSQQNYGRIVSASVVASFVQLSGTYVICNSSAAYYYFLVPFMLARVTRIIIQSYSVSNLIFINVRQYSLDIQLGKAGIPLLISTLAGLIYAAQDQWMISMFMDFTNVGIYAAATKIILFVLVIPTIITNLLYEKIIKQRSYDDYEQFIKMLYTLIFYLALTSVIVTYIVSYFLINYIYPPAYTSGIDVLNIYASILIFAFFQSLNNKILILQNMQSLIMARTLTALLLNAILNFWLIQSVGLVGAALATVASELFITLSYGFHKKTRNIFWYQVTAINPQNLTQLIHQNWQKND